MKDRAFNMVMASFAADSLALGAHWIYDAQAIAQQFGRVNTLLKPRPNSYHPTKDAGDFTHYGDQTFVLLESLAAQKGFSPDDFSARWKALFEDYDGYVDQATQGTLARYDSGKGLQDGGSPSDDLAGAARLAPLVFTYPDNLERLLAAAREQTRMTHNSPPVLESAAFFAETASRVLGGMSPVKALQQTANEKFADSSLSGWVNAGLQSAADDSVQTIIRFGQSCHTREAFPGVIHLIAKYESDLKEALVQSVMAGGDSAARGMLVGTVLGAHLGAESLPKEWASSLKREKQIIQLLQNIR